MQCGRYKAAYRWFEEGFDALDVRRPRSLLTGTGEASVDD